LGTESLNCSVNAIRQCGDKLTLAGQLETLKIPTIPTREFSDPHILTAKDLEFPLVIKPRDGAGSQDTFLIQGKEEWQNFLKDNSRTGQTADWIMQPYILGKTLSIAAIVGDLQWNDEPWLEVFPLAEQQFTPDGRFGYLGGRIPETISLQHLATQRVHEIVAHVPGLSGYIGLDLLAPRHDPEELLIVEINPRLTTSYLGYRALADQNLAEYLLPALRPDEPLRWKPQIVRFTAEGNITLSERLR
jgi:predicted ATP-grasp superfamily ATP-dependent carboligase